MKYGMILALVVLCCGIFSNSVRGSFFVMPIGGTLYASAVGGTGAAVSEFGTGTSIADFNPLLTGLPATPVPTGEVVVGAFAAGTSVNFGMETAFGGTYFAFSDDTTSASARTAYMDLGNKLGMGGNVVESLGSNEYLLHLDDAASYMIDDNNNDFLIQLRIVPAVPEPTAACILLGSGLVMMRRRNR
ncbi:MAG TPA: hypothetical protein VFE58_03390 [Tepidisphaeraceae bacterium]|jgi:hypothetical protein|nr:hypothetical protein [Tepidisphaeraceae bacterium]